MACPCRDFNIRLRSFALASWNKLASPVFAGTSRFHYRKICLLKVTRLAFDDAVALVLRLLVGLEEEREGVRDERGEIREDEKSWSWKWRYANVQSRQSA